MSKPDWMTKSDALTGVIFAEVEELTDDVNGVSHETERAAADEDDNWDVSLDCKIDIEPVAIIDSKEAGCRRTRGVRLAAIDDVGFVVGDWKFALVKEAFVGEIVFPSRNTLTSIF